MAQYKAKAYAYLRVFLANLSDGKTKQLSFPASLAWQLRSTVQDGGRALAFSPDGRWLVVGTRSGWIYRWDLREDQPKPASWQAHQDEICDLVLLPDGTSLYSGSGDKTVARWDVPGGWKEAARCPGDRTMCLTLTPEASRLAVSDEA